MLSTRVVCLFLLTNLSLSAQQKGTIKGVVTDESGATFPQVTVSLRTASAPTLLTVKTDDKGRFEIPNLEPGTYSMTARFMGGLPYRSTVVVRSNETTEVSPVLPVGCYPPDKAEAREPPSSLADIEVKLTHWGSFGCPSYSIVLKGDTAIYYPQDPGCVPVGKLVAPPKRRRIPFSNFQALVKRLYDINFFGFGEYCGSGIDAPGSRVSIRVGSEPKEVSHGIGFEPEQLAIIEAEIKKLAGVK